MRMIDLGVTEKPVQPVANRFDQPVAPCAPVEGKPRMMTGTYNEFLSLLAVYRDGVQTMVDEYMKQYDALPHRDKVELECGNARCQYVRVFVTTYINGVQNGKRIHSFVDKKTGNVLKAAGWKKPVTINPRSNVYDTNYGLNGVNWHGANYLR